MTYIKKTKTFTSDYIGKDIIEHLKNKKPFSLVRIGDGDLRLMKNIDKIKLFKEGKIEILEIGYIRKFRQQGIEPKKIPDIYEIYEESCNNANYISGFDCWLDSPDYWNRKTGSKAAKKVLKNWKQTYEKMNIINENYCNPDINFHLFMHENFNLLNFIKNEKICLITPWVGAIKRLKKCGFNVDHIKIPHMNLKGTKIKDVKDITKLSEGKIWHSTLYDNIKNEISEKCNNCSIFFVGSGTLGRGYCDHIKKCGRISIDIGKVMDSWHIGESFGRNSDFFFLNNISFVLNEKYKKYNGKF